MRIEMAAIRATETLAAKAPAGRFEIVVRPGVTTPDWSVVGSEIVRAALGPLLAATPQTA